MSQATSGPSIIHDSQNYSVVQNKPFSVNLSEIFSPSDGTLRFYLKTPKPEWLYIDEHSGRLYGIAPKVTHKKPFKVTLNVSNEMGNITKSFILTVMADDVVEEFEQTLEHILSKRKENYGLSHIHPYTPSLIEYLYYFYQQPEYLQQFEKSVRDAAAAQKVKLSGKIEFRDFDNLIKKINPEFEKILREALGKDHILTVATLNNQHLHNLYRMGSQPQGVITIPVWNHCGYADLYNWSDMGPISNVLDAAADSVRKLEEQNLKHDQKHDQSPGYKR